MALAVVAVVIAGQERGVDVDRVGDGFAEAVALESHDCGLEDLCTGRGIEIWVDVVE